MQPPLIGLFGYSRTGKDTFADVLVQEFSALRVSQGDGIKETFKDLLSLKETVFEFAERMQGQMDLDAFWKMYFHHGAAVIDFAKTIDPEHGVDAFTQVDWIKDRIRPLLEHGGYVILDYVERHMWEQVDDYPGLVINSRLFDVPQCEAWRNRGGLIWEVHKPGVGPKTDYEEKNVSEVRAAGFVNLDIMNDSTVGDLQNKARKLISHVMQRSIDLAS